VGPEPDSLRLIGRKMMIYGASHAARCPTQWITWGYRCKYLRRKARGVSTADSGSPGRLTRGLFDTRHRCCKRHPVGQIHDLYPTLSYLHSQRATPIHAFLDIFRPLGNVEVLLSALRYDMPITTSARDPRYRKQAKQQVKIQRAANKRENLRTGKQVT